MQCKYCLQVLGGSFLGTVLQICMNMQILVYLVNFHNQGTNTNLQSPHFQTKPSLCTLQIGITVCKNIPPLSSLAYHANVVRPGPG